MPLHAEVCAEGSTIKEHLKQISHLGNFYLPLPFLIKSNFSPSVFSRQNKLWVDLLTDVSLTRKSRECLTPWLYWIMNYFENQVSDMLIDVCQHCPSEKSFIKTKTRQKSPPWAHIRRKEDWKDIFGGMFMCQSFAICGVECVGEWLLFGHFKKRN